MYQTNDMGCFINSSTGKIIDKERAILAIHDLLKALGEDVKREGLKDTPRRVLGYWLEALSYEPGNFETQFEAGDAVNQMVWVKDIEFVSHCEHHLALIRGKCTVAYITEDKVIGLSKIPRIVQKYAHALTLQEQMGNNIANEIEKILGTENIAVYIEADHSCMQCRGIKASHSPMITNVLRGAFMEKSEVRAEFMSVCMSHYR